MFRRRTPQPAIAPEIDGCVLVVDDDPRQRIEVANCLTRIGLRVVECGDGDSVLELVGAEQPDLVILDINLPGRDGDSLVGDIHAGHPQTKILLMTGDPERARAANEARLDVFTVMEKPVPLRALVRFVTSAIVASRGRSWEPRPGLHRL